MNSKNKGNRFINYIVSGAKNVMQTSHAVLDQLGRAY